jgi:tetratricopeptide (TPR) repeat protein
LESLCIHAIISRVPEPHDAARDARTPRIFVALLALVCAYAVWAQFAILSQGFRDNPFTRSPINDAAEYWQWAGEIASGRLVDTIPFMSAPLYPYVVGAARALGASIAGTYVLQIAMHLATVLLLFRIGRRRFDPLVGVLAAAIYVLMQEPAFFAGRVLNSTVQALVTALLWERAIALEHALDRRDRSARWPIVGFGIALGLNIVANPPWMAGLVLAAVWVFWRSGRGKLGVVRAVGAVALALVVVAPSALHNYLACGEFIPVSAQGGLGFYHGNSPGAVGTYKPVPGISADRTKQNIDARELMRAETDGSWRGASSAFMKKGLDFWKSDPPAAVRLFFRKIYWFLSARNYGDIYQPSLEIEAGIATALRWTFVPVAWFTACGLVMVVLLVVRSRRYLLEAVLLAAPLFTCAIFWYSPRYRFPVVPILVVLGAAALVEIFRRRPPIAWIAALTLSLALGLSFGRINEAVGFDRIDANRAAFEQLLGSTLAAEGKLQEAAIHHRRANELGEPEAAASLGDVLRRLGRDNESLTVLRDAARARPNNAYTHRSLAVALAQRGELAEAETEFRAALRIDPNDWESLSGLGNVHTNRGEFAQAIERYGEALRLNPSFANAHFNLGGALMGEKRWADAMESFRAALALDPTLVQARASLAELHAMQGDFDGAVNELRAALALAPDQDALRIDLAWHLATAPNAAVRNGAEAVHLAEELNHQTNGEDPLILDTLAAAFAESGRFDDAQKTIDRAIELLGKDLTTAELSEFVARRDLYRARQPFRQPRP